MWEHKHKLTPGFTSRYNINKLVYFEETADVREAIARVSMAGDVLERRTWLRQ